MVLLKDALRDPVLEHRDRWAVLGAPPVVSWVTVPCGADATINKLAEDQ